MLRNWKRLCLAALVAPAALAVPARLQAQPSGAELWSRTCGSCHAMQPANRYSADQWETIMVQMRIQARLSREQSDAILDFLKGGARRVAAAVPPLQAAVLARLASTELILPDVGDSIAETFRKMCGPCHGSAGKGDGPAASALRPRPPDLTDSATVALTNQELAAVIAEGKGSMPGFGKQLTAEQLTAMRDYVRSLAAGR